MSFKDPISWKDFEKLDIRVGTILKASSLENAIKPAYKLVIDFGQEIGTKKTSAQITDLYKEDSLIGRQILAVLNFPPKQIGTFMSECLVLGLYGKNGVVLIQPEQEIENGSRLG